MSQYEHYGTGTSILWCKEGCRSKEREGASNSTSVKAGKGHLMMRGGSGSRPKECLGKGAMAAHKRTSERRGDD